MNCMLCNSRMATEPDMPSVEVRRCLCCGWQIMKESWASDLEVEEETNPKRGQARELTDPVFEPM